MRRKLERLARIDKGNQRETIPFCSASNFDSAPFDSKMLRAHWWFGQTTAASAATANLARSTINDGYSRQRNHLHLVLLSDISLIWGCNHKNVQRLMLYWCLGNLWKKIEPDMKARTRRIYACLRTLSEPLCVRWGPSNFNIKLTFVGHAHAASNFLPEAGKRKGKSLLVRVGPNTFKH